MSGLILSRSSGAVIITWRESTSGRHLEWRPLDEQAQKVQETSDDLVLGLQIR